MDTTARGQLSSSSKNVSSFTLKIVAIIGMTCNHASHIFAAHLPFGLYTVCFSLGGLTFPIMAFLVVEGYRHTSSLKKYALRLFVFALISQIPYYVFLGGEGNVLFTLLVGLGVLYCYDRLENKLLFFLVFLAAVFGSMIFDWGSIGIVMIFLFYVLKGRYASKIVPLLIPVLVMGPAVLASSLDFGPYTSLPDILYLSIGLVVTTALLLGYKGRRGRPLKYFFYFYYPLHILALGLLQVLFFGAV